jgi:UbiD family decarboxylase
MVEGPFGEYVGYMAGLKLPRPVIRVKAVTHRNNPILTMSCEGMPTTDTHTIMGVTRPGELLDAFRERGLPVTGVCMFAETGPYLAVVAIKATRNNLAEEIAHVIWATRIGRITPYIIVVEDDVDPFDLAQVIHAMITKCHPYRGIVRLEHTTAGVFMPWANEFERKYQVGAKVYFDCTWPLDWNPSIVPTKISFKKSYPLDIQKKALAKLYK